MGPLAALNLIYPRTGIESVCNGEKNLFLELQGTECTTGGIGSEDPVWFGGVERIGSEPQGDPLKSETH